MVFTECLFGYSYYVFIRSYGLYPNKKSFEDEAESLCTNDREDNRTAIKEKKKRCAH